MFNCHCVYYWKWTIVGLFQNQLFTVLICCSSFNFNSKLFERQSSITVSVHTQLLSNVCSFTLRLFLNVDFSFVVLPHIGFSLTKTEVQCCLNAICTPQAFCSADFWMDRWLLFNGHWKHMQLACHYVLCLHSFVLREHQHITVTTIYIINF